MRVALASAAQPSLGLGLVILAVGLLMAGLAVMSLRTIWTREPPPEPLPRQGPLPPLRDPGIAAAARGMSTGLRAALSVDFGCLTAVAIVLCGLGLVLVLRALGA